MRLFFCFVVVVGIQLMVLGSVKSKPLDFVVGGVMAAVVLKWAIEFEGGKK